MDMHKAMNESGLLAPGEKMVAHLMVQAAGSFARQAALGAGGNAALIALAGKRKNAGSDGDEPSSADRFVRKSGLLVLTDQRLMLCKTGALVSKPKEVVADLTIEDIDRIVHERKRGVHRLEVFCTDGSSVAFDAMGGKAAESVANAFVDVR
jgi:hypothetical protein